jgi:hypothetical protein
MLLPFYGVSLRSAVYGRVIPPHGSAVAWWHGVRCCVDQNESPKGSDLTTQLMTEVHGAWYDVMCSTTRRERGREDALCDVHRRVLWVEWFEWFEWLEWLERFES